MTGMEPDNGRSYRMQRLDFEFDTDRFNGVLGRNNRMLTVTKQHLLNMISHWSGFTQSMLGGNASIEVDEKTKNVSGTVLGKSFNVTFGVLATDDFCRIEAIVSTPKALSGTSAEVARFYIASDGSVFSSDNEPLMQEHEEFQSYTLLTAVLRKVLSTPQAL